MVFKSKVRAREGFDWAWDAATVGHSGSREYKHRRDRRIHNIQHHKSRSSQFISYPLVVLIFAVALLLSIPHEVLLQPTSQYIRSLAENGLPEVPGPAWHLAPPSYQRMCRAILSEASQTSNADEGKVYENMSLCLENHDLSNSLANIFASTFLSHAASTNGIDVTYEHKCYMRQLEKEDKSRQTVLQLLPAKIKITEDVTGKPVMDKASLYKLCEQVVDLSWDDAKSFEGPWIVMNFAVTPQKEVENHGAERYTVLEYMLPTIRESLVQAVEAWSRSGRAKERLVTKTVGGYSIEQMKAPRDVDKVEKSSPSDLKNLKAAIYLPCLDKNCTDAAVLPFYEYYLNIPNNIKSLDILIPLKCLQNIGRCKESANNLARFMVELYPRADITLVRHGHDGSMDHFQRLYDAEYALCGPGWGTMCLFPSLARPPTTDGSRIVIMEREQSQDKFTTARVLDSISSHFDPQVKIVVPVLAKGHEELGDSLRNFTMQNLPQGDPQCRKMRGRLGKWERNDEMARSLQYSESVKHLWGKADQKHRNLIKNGMISKDSVRESTRYVWNDGQTSMMEENGPNCGIELMTKEGMCATMQEMKMGRIFIVGDSLSLSQSLSVHKLMGLSGRLPWDEHRASFKQKIECPYSSQNNTVKYSFTLEVARNNLLLKMSDAEVDIYHSQPYQFAIQWEKRFLEDNSRTLMVVNVGAHIKHANQFEATMDQFLRTLDVLESTRQYKDLIMWRTNVPGHWACEEPHSRKPHGNYQDYVKKQAKALEQANTRDYWSLFEPLNDYVISVVEARAMQPGAKANIEILDVHPMTVLRQDGHVMKDSNVENTTDCLHYSLPGPADWWNHLMYSNLLDIAAKERALKVVKRPENEPAALHQQ